MTETKTKETPKAKGVTAPATEITTSIPIPTYGVAFLLGSGGALITVNFWAGNQRAAEAIKAGWEEARDTVTQWYDFTQMDGSTASLEVDSIRGAWVIKS